MGRYAKMIGFGHPEKSLRLSSFSNRKLDTNVDVVRVLPDDMLFLRQSLSLFQWEIAERSGCDRTMISMLESGNRQPSRRLLRRVLGTLASAALEKKVIDLKWWGRLREIASRRRGSERAERKGRRKVAKRSRVR